MTVKNIENLRYLFKTSPVLSSQLPIKFESAVSWHSLTISCERCKQDIPDEMVRGTLSSLIPTVVTIEGVAFCRNCLLLHRVQYRFRADGAIEYIVNGKWVKNYGEKSAWFPKVMEKIQNLLRNVGKGKNRV